MVGAVEGVLVGSGFVGACVVTVIVGDAVIRVGVKEGCSVRTSVGDKLVGASVLIGSDGAFVGVMVISTSVGLWVGNDVGSNV